MDGVTNISGPECAFTCFGGPGSVRTAAWRENWLGSTKDFSQKYIATIEILTSLKPLSAVFTMCYANAHPAIWQPICTELARGA